MEENNANEREEIFSERVRAGKRTYFFDVKATRSNDYYLTITESKRKYKEDGFTYEKHKIFLYKEDFDKFVDALNNTVGHVKEELLPDVDFSEFDRNKEVESTETSEKGSNTELKWD
ncbi:MAG: PUR family DNA/RNA-binding protein [Cyclobacteriaceae bacterium]|nr:PUR family DNA/RNA-binding protein [Cyclobacteriaceae bacterium]